MILSLEADFVAEPPGEPAPACASSPRAARSTPRSREMNRLYVVEGTPTSTGAVADHRLALRSSEIEGFARARGGGRSASRSRAASAHAVGRADRAGPEARRRAGARDRRRVAAAGGARARPRDQRGAGRRRHDRRSTPSPPRPRRSARRRPSRRSSARCSAGAVEVLVDPRRQPGLRRAGRPRRSREALDKVPLRDPPRALPRRDGRALPLAPAGLAPARELGRRARRRRHRLDRAAAHRAALQHARPSIEVLAALRRGAEQKGYDVAARALGGAARRGRLREALEPRRCTTASSPAPPSRRRPVKVARRRVGQRAPKAPAAGGLEIAFRPDPVRLRRPLREHRLAAGAAEAAHARSPGTTRPWSSPKTAAALGGVRTEQTASGHVTEVVELRSAAARVKAPVWVLPGHADGAVTVHLGYGRRARGPGRHRRRLRRLRAAHERRAVGGGRPRGRARPARPRASPAPRTTGRWRRPRSDQAHERHVVRAVTLAELAQDPHAVQEMGHEPAPGLSLYPEHEYEGHAWGMAIDLSACIGCNACVDRLPVREQHPGGRQGPGRRAAARCTGSASTATTRAPPESPETVHQPVPCMHCENAPCEVVCPVAATVHSDEGLNDMVYNRCVGTRYCSNNCPYKVRRFNFLLYQDWETPSLQDDAQPRGHGAQPRRDGEVHLLRAAHQPRRASTPRTQGRADRRTARS